VRDQLDLHVHGVCQLRMRGPERTQLHNLPWLLADRTRGVCAHQRCQLYPNLGISPKRAGAPAIPEPAGHPAASHIQRVERKDWRSTRQLGDDVGVRGDRRNMAADNVQTFTDVNFSEQVLQSARPVLVDFWAEWCGPCKRIAPTVDALAGDFDGRAVIGKLNVDDNPRTPAQYSVRGIPTLLVFKGGQVVDSIVGAQVTKDQLAKIIENHL
jgi:thioredoxin